MASVKREEARGSFAFFGGGVAGDVLEASLQPASPCGRRDGGGAAITDAYL